MTLDLYNNALSGLRLFEEYALWGYGKMSSYTQPQISKFSKFEINKVCDSVYIGDFSSACNTDELKRIGITHIVTAILGVEPMYPDLFTYYMVDISDRSHSEIYKHFNECSEFIDDCIANHGKVLVHCRCGVSRSSTLIAAWLISKKNYTATSAVSLIQNSRAQVKPNEGFIKQLEQYESLIQKEK
jgi:protein-tyrosine phosphatase